MVNISKDISTSTEKTVELSGDVMNELINVVLHSVGGIFESVNSVTKASGNITDNVMDNKIGVKTTQIFKNVGVTAKKVSDSLGKVVNVVPLVGGPVAYVVKRAGEGVYHIVVSVGKIAGSTAKKVGNLAKKTTDLIVFTLSAVNDEIQRIGKSVTDLISTLTKRQPQKKTEKNKNQSIGNKRRKSRRNSKKSSKRRQKP